MTCLRCAAALQGCRGQASRAEGRGRGRGERAGRLLTLSLNILLTSPAHHYSPELLPVSRLEMSDLSAHENHLQQPRQWWDLGAAREFRETGKPSLCSHCTAALQPDEMGSFLLRNNQDITAEMSEDSHVSTNIPEDQTDYAAPECNFLLVHIPLAGHYAHGKPCLLEAWK